MTTINPVHPSTARIVTRRLGWFPRAALCMVWLQVGAMLVIASIGLDVTLEVPGMEEELKEEGQTLAPNASLRFSVDGRVVTTLNKTEMEKGKTIKLGGLAEGNHVLKIEMATGGERGSGSCQFEVEDVPTFGLIGMALSPSGVNEEIRGFDGVPRRVPGCSVVAIEQ